MNIAVVMTVFPAISETFITNEITGLIDLGHDVNVFAFSKPADKKKIHTDVLKYHLNKLTRYFNIPKNRLLRAVRVLRAFFYILVLNPSAIKHCLNSKKYSRYEALNNLLKLEPFLFKKYDIIHCHFGPNALELLFLKDIYSVKLVVSFHGYDVSKIPHEQGNDCYKDLFERGDLFLPASRHFKEKLMSFGCLEEKIKIHYASIDLDLFQFKQRSLKTDRIEFVTLARLVEKKGLFYMILAISEILRKYSDATCYVIGNGKQKQELEELARKCDPRGRIQFLGSMTHDKILEYLYRSDIFILPSVTAIDGDQEAIPSVLKEAMATGMPVISTYHGGIPELISDGRTGFLVQERDVEGLTEKINYAINNPQLCREMGKVARIFVEENFCKKKLNHELEGFYEYIVAN